MKRLLSKLLCLLTLLFPLKLCAQDPIVVQNGEPYVVLSQDNTVLLFYYDDQREARGGLNIGPDNYYDNTPWYSDRKNLTTVVIDESFASYTELENTSWWFNECSNLTYMYGLQYLNTSNVKNMSSMFYRCSALTSLDVSNFNTENVTSMNFMFYGCSALTTLDVSNFNTESVTNMNGMFELCSGLTTLGLGNLNTMEVTDMESMFTQCSNLTVLDLSSFNTENVTNMRAMFYGCEALTTIYVGEGWSTAKVEAGNEMFTDCFNLKGGQGTEYMQINTNVDYAHIDGGAKDPGYFTDKNASEKPVVQPYGVLTDQMMKLTLYYDDNIASHTEGIAMPWEDMLSSNEYSHAREMLATIEFDPSFAGYTELTCSGYLFAGCRNLTTINGLEYLVTDNMMEMREMFASCESLTSLDLSSFNTSKVTEMWGMFMGCGHLTTIYVGSGWTTAALTDDGHEMFAECYSLVGGMGTTYSNEHFNADYAHIDGGPSNPGYLTARESEKQDITEFEVDGIFYRVRHQQDEHQVTVVHVMHAYDELYVPYEVEYARTMWRVTALAENAFVDLQEVKVIRIPASVDSISVNLFSHCPHLAAIIWETTIPLTAAAMGQINNPNLLLFVRNVANAPAGVTNVVDLENRVAEKIVLTDAESNSDFCCPMEFTAKQISYSHKYQQATQSGKCQGWESIVLPFDVQKYTHETQGEIFPFAMLLDEWIVDGDRPFWLYEYTDQGQFVEAEGIRANVPYILSMPNEPELWDIYKLNGRVTFSATDVMVLPTMDVFGVEAGNRWFVPCYRHETESPHIFLLNVGDAYEDHAEGSVFSNERQARLAHPFEAYFVMDEHNPVRGYIDIFDDATGIQKMRNGENEKMRNGENEKMRNGVYDLSGRKVTSLHAPLSTLRLPKGIYLQNGKKIVNGKQ